MNEELVSKETVMLRPRASKASSCLSTEREVNKDKLTAVGNYEKLTFRA